MKNVARMMETATTQHRAGKLAEAERLYNEILQIDQSHTGARGLLGALYMQTNQPARAIETLEIALKSGPQPDVLNNLGTALAGEERFAEAAQRYEEALRLRSDFPNAHFNLAYTLEKLGQTEDAIAHYEDALRQKPDYLKALFHLGQALRATGKLDDAITRYEEAVHSTPGNFRLLNNLGNYLREAGRSEDAVAQYKEALRLKPGYAEASINLGTVLRDLGRAEEALASYDAALRLQPNDPDVQVNIGVALFCDFQRLDDAIARYDAALRLNPNSVDAQWNKAIALLAKGDYRDGWRLYESGLGKEGKRAKPFKAKSWDGRPFPGEKLLIWCEQGLGDALQFVRYAEMCKERFGKVAVHAPVPLTRILKTNPFIDEVVTTASEGDFQHHVSMLSLPHVFGTTLETVSTGIPYLSVTPDVAAKWAKRFTDARGFKVGLVWAGGPRDNHAVLNFIDKRRSLHLSQFKPLLDIKGARFYSLQLGKPAAQITELGLQDKIADFTNDIGDFMDTAAIIDQLDLVISVDTSVAHLAGALGKPVWVLSRFDACWRWLQNRETSPWYPKARIFGQPKPGDWNSVINKAHTALGDAVAQKPSM